jgi:hypothetical protein
MIQRISAYSSRSPLRPAHSRMGLGGRIWLFLARFAGRVEPVELLDHRFNFLPRSFRWRGDLWRVRAIVRVWERPRAGLRPARRYFEVACGQAGSYLLFQDLHVGTWHVSL